MLKNKGFTLIELIIIVAIIGILTAVAIPKFADLTRKSREGATKGALTNLRSALKIYFSDSATQHNPNFGGDGTLAGGEGLDSFVPKYIDAIPTVKLGTYHSDSNQIISKSTEAYNRGAIASLYDVGGWIYTSSGDGSFFVDCIHTDTKNIWFTNW